MLPWVIMPAVATGGTKQCGSATGDGAVFSQQDILHFQFAVCQSRTSPKCCVTTGLFESWNNLWPFSHTGWVLLEHSSWLHHPRLAGLDFSCVNICHRYLFLPLLLPLYPTVHQQEGHPTWVWSCSWFLLVKWEPLLPVGGQDLGF